MMSLPRGKKTERILRVLLNDPGGELSKYKIAKSAKTSFSWVHEYLERLENFGYIKDTRVLDFSALFDIWKKQRDDVQKKNFVINDPMSILSEINLNYALTTYQGENLVQGFLFPSRFDVYIQRKDYNDWNDLLRKSGLMGSGNFRLLIEDEHVFYKSKIINEFKVVSVPQLIVDLYKEGGVCGEAADNLVNSMVLRNV